MTGHSKEEDPGLDEDFVLDDLDLDEPTAASGAPAGDAADFLAAADPDAGRDSDDILFEVPKGPARRRMTSGQFRESGGTDWGGAEMSAEEIGIPLDPNAMELEPSNEIEEVELEADDTIGAEAETEAGIGDGLENAIADGGEEPFVVVDGDGSQAMEAPAGGDDQVPEEWAAAAEETEADADAAPADGGGEEFVEEAPEYAEAEIDASDRGGTLLTAAPRRRRLVLRNLVAAGVLVLVGGVGIAVWQPQWLGLADVEPQVERTPIARPNDGVDLKAPELPTPGNTDRKPEPTPDPTPEPRGEPRTDPGTDPKSDPRTDPTPIPDFPLPDPLPDPSTANDPVLRPMAEIRVGEELRIGERAGAVEASPLPLIAQGMVIGTQALAQLHNGNFFLGTVKAMDASAMTLRLEKGEVTLVYADITQLSAIGSQEYQELKKAEKGYVRLNNQNRLVGNILKVGVSDHVILEMKQSRVVIPRAAIEEIGSSAATGVKLTDDENDEWVRKIVERSLHGEATVPETPGTGPAPDPMPASRPSGR